MERITTIGLEIAKQVFQVHGVDALGAVVVRRKLRRDDVTGFFKALPPCLIGVEACATGHHWARVLMALDHEARLMPASYVKPYVKRQKNDATDAEAICEAVTRPTMRFVPVKSQEQQSVLMLHRIREVLFLVVAATTAVCEDYDEIALWGEQHLSFRRFFSKFHFGTPCADWLRVVMNRIDPDFFQARFTDWALSLRPTPRSSSRSTARPRAAAMTGAAAARRSTSSRPSPRLGA